MRHSVYSPYYVGYFHTFSTIQIERIYPTNVAYIFYHYGAVPNTGAVCLRRFTSVRDNCSLFAVLVVTYEFYSKQFIRYSLLVCHEKTLFVTIDTQPPHHLS